MLETASVEVLPLPAPSITRLSKKRPEAAFGAILESKSKKNGMFAARKTLSAEIA
jgi:hypothetical protein